MPKSFHDQSDYMQILKQSSFDPNRVIKIYDLIPKSKLI